MSDDLTREDKAFLGTGWTFPPTFNRYAGRVETIAAEEDIRQSIQIILKTQPGERLMQPTFGCDLHQFLFAGFEQSTIVSLKRAIADALLYHEPRISVNRININTHQETEGLLLVEIDYTIRQTNARDNLVYPFYLTEATNI